MTAVDLPMDVLAHSRFFDHLVDLIPAKFYHTEEEPPQNLKYMKKDAREPEKAKRKSMAKAAKRAKLDPETAQTALDVQRRGVVRIEEAGGSEGEEEGAAAPQDAARGPEAGPAKAKEQPRKALRIDGEKGSAASMEELRTKLHSRLTVLREQRKVEERKKSAADAAKWRDRSQGEAKDKLTQPLSKKRKEKDGGKGGQTTAAAVETEPETQLTFGQLTFGQDAEAYKSKKQKKPSKAELLTEAEQKQAERQNLAASTEGQAKLQKEAWGSALSRAKGEKILDDPKLLRKSLKKEQKVKDKKAGAWKERKQYEKKQGKERQQKRRDNLQARVTQVKQKKIAKREKKLMRPGFEGRRDTPINGK